MSGVAPGFSKCKKVEKILECNLQEVGYLQSYYELGKLVNRVFYDVYHHHTPIFTRRICLHEAKRKTNIGNVIGEQQKGVGKKIQRSTKIQSQQ